MGMLHSGITARERFGSRLKWSGFALFAVSLAIGAGLSESHEITTVGKVTALGMVSGLSTIVAGLGIIASEHSKLRRMGII